MGNNLSVILMPTALIQVQLFPIPKNPKNISTFIKFLITIGIKNHM